MPRGRFAAELLAFYPAGEGPGGSGRTLAQVLAWPDPDWEIHHDFIQWVFPTDEASRYNPDAPVLDESAVARFRADPTRGPRLGESFGRWLGFCGGEFAGAGGLAFAARIRRCGGVGTTTGCARDGCCAR